MQDVDRQAEMVRATLDCIAEKGLQATTVRAVAGYAGVSNGLVRHHFAAKENLILAAYRETIAMLTAPGRAVSALPDLGPHERLSRFVALSIGGDVADPRMFSLWATFISQIHVNPDFAQLHDEGHIPYRALLEPMIAALMNAENREIAPARCTRLAVMTNAVIDGLWLEGCLYRQTRSPAEQVELGLETIEVLLGTTLPRIAPGD